MSEPYRTNEDTQSIGTGFIIMAHPVPDSDNQAGVEVNHNSQGGIPRRYRHETLREDEDRVTEERREVAKHFATL